MCDYTFTYLPDVDGWKMPTTDIIVSRELLNDLDEHHATSILTMWCNLPVPSAVASKLKNIPLSNPLHFDW